MNLSEFIQYMHDFYGVNGLYPMNITNEEILIGIGIRLERFKDIEFEGDTLDREKVRDIVIELRKNHST